MAGLDAGGDEYLTKPVDHAALVARVRSILRIKALHDTVQDAGGASSTTWNRTLEQRVAAQVAELERLGRAAAVPAAAGRRARSCPRATSACSRATGARSSWSFCDLRGFTAFAETAEPEEVMACPAASTTTRSAS